ncbi:unnamed protein product [Citrullus colocynthis]|uniref:Uncharacterized protein n=1 Tax=Citrullus colocynthis TaxID=252529 RepID=A0ABP0Z1B3_9ROSI
MVSNLFLLISELHHTLLKFIDFICVLVIKRLKTHHFFTLICLREREKDPIPTFSCRQHGFVGCRNSDTLKKYTNFQFNRPISARFHHHTPITVSKC